MLVCEVAGSAGQWNDIVHGQRDALRTDGEGALDDVLLNNLVCVLGQSCQSGFPFFLFASASFVLLFNSILPTIIFI